MYFKIHLFVFIILCLFGHVLAECPIDTFPQETTSSVVKICVNTNTTTCGDLKSLFITPMETVVQEGCTVYKCADGYPPTVIGSFEKTEIPVPADKPDDNEFRAEPPESMDEIEGDMFLDHFGLVCDDDKWKATRYPNGIGYYAIDKLYPIIGEDGSLDGIKTDVVALGCIGSLEETMEKKKDSK